MQKKAKPRRTRSKTKTVTQLVSRRRGRKPSFKEMMAMRGHYRSYKQARAFVRSLKLKSYKEWLRYCRGRMTGKKTKPMDIPQNPRDTYLDKGWAGFADWLGTGNISFMTHSWRSFSKARAFVRKLKLRSNREWRAYVRGDLPHKPRRPQDIPTNPNYAYSQREWKGDRDWLGAE